MGGPCSEPVVGIRFPPGVHAVGKLNAIVILPRIVVKS